MIIRLLVSFSALCASLAFVFPFWCAELIFIFLIPLFFAVKKSKFFLSYKEGLLWGALFYAVYFYDLFRVILYKGYGWGRVIAVIILFGYACFYTALWFGLARKLTISITEYSSRCFMPFVSWTIVTWFYFYWIDSAFFWIFGNCEGNQLNHPILPLAIRPQWLYFLPILGKNGLFLLVIIFCVSIVLLITQYKRIAVITTVLCCLIFLIGWMPFVQKNEVPTWLTRIGCIALESDDQKPWDVAEKIMVLLEEFAISYPTIDIVLMPESTFKFPLNSLKRSIQLWNREGISLIIGSHRKEGDNLFNTLYLIKNGTITDFHDKTHTLFFTERIPWLWGYFSGSQELFLKENRAFNQSNQTKKMHLETLGEFVPLLCSELFFLKNRLCKNSLSLCFVNDSWFFSDYIPNLMVFHATIVALTYQSPMVYAGYRSCRYIDVQGNHHFLPMLNK